MLKSEHYFQMSDGHEIFIRTYMPSEQPIGHLHVLHGMAEHCGRYDHFAQALCERGYLVSMHDHRGHGFTAKKSGKLGHFAEEKGFDRVVTDVFEVVEQIRDGMNLPPLTLFGHSMGSFIARRYVQLYSSAVNKVILCGTGATTSLHKMGRYIGVALGKKYGKSVPSKFMNDMSFGSYNKKIVNPKTPFDWLCTVEEEVVKYMKDPYCGFIGTAQFFVDVATSLIVIDRQSELSKMRKDLPVLFISGAEDPVGNYGKGVFHVAKRFANVEMERVTVHLFERKRHEILNEDNKLDVYKVILRWLEDK